MLPGTNPFSKLHYTILSAICKAGQISECGVWLVCRYWYWKGWSDCQLPHQQRRDWDSRRRNDYVTESIVPRLEPTSRQPTSWSIKAGGKKLLRPLRWPWVRWTKQPRRV